MTALLLWDLNEEKSTANPNVLLRHVMCLFEENSVHGGSWRCPYDLTKMGLVSYACGRLVRKPGSVPLDCHVENSQQEENN